MRHCESLADAATLHRLLNRDPEAPPWIRGRDLIRSTEYRVHVHTDYCDRGLLTSPAVLLLHTSVVFRTSNPSPSYRGRGLYKIFPGNKKREEDATQEKYIHRRPDTPCNPTFFFIYIYLPGLPRPRPRPSSNTSFSFLPLFSVTALREIRSPFTQLTPR